MDPRSLADDLLELTVFASFSNLGIRARRRLFGWDDPVSGSLRGQTALVTGPTSGLGREIANGLAGLGARVVLVGRSAERLAGVHTELAAAHGEDRFPLVVADLSSLASVRRAADEILATEPRLDVLVDNAGAIYPTRTESPDGIEATLATLVVGPFVLLGRLLPRLEGSPGGGRAIAITSGGMYAQAVNLDDLEWATEAYDGTRAYARAKRIQVALVREWARRMTAAGIRVRVDAMHPGWADTPGLQESLPRFANVMGPLLRSPAEGADTALWLASRRGASDGGGRLYHDRRARPFDRLPTTRLDPDDRRHLWEAVVARSGGPDPIAEFLQSVRDAGSE